MPTVDEKNAAFRVIKSEVETWAEQLLPQNVPFIGNVREMAVEKLDSQEGTDYLLQLTTDALTAAENVRNKAAQQAKK
jgi:hypothetical protein